MALPYRDGVELINKAITKRDEERAWQMWLMRYQHMTKQSFVPFKDFYKPKPMQVSTKSTEQVLDLAEKIKNADLGKDNSSS